MKKLILLTTLLALMVLQVAFAQNRTITGTVTSENGETLPGVSVVIKGTSYGTVTDIDGKYSISAAKDVSELDFSFIGMKTLTGIVKGNTCSVVMIAQSIGVDEVVVMAFGTASKESLTGSAAVVGAEMIESRSVSSVGQILTGATSGVQTTAGSGQPGSSPSIRIRGVGTLNTSAAPLIVLDGAQYSGNISSLNPNDIASMTVLKDASSTALYGSRAANGVIIITTKKGVKGAENMQFTLKAQGGIVTEALPYYETVDAKDYYELQAEGFAQSEYHSGNIESIDAARSYAYENIFSQLKYNPFVGIANDEILGGDGKINPDAEVAFPSLDWLDEVTQTGYRQNYDLSVNGGSQKTSYFLSMGYLKESGYVIKSDYERYNVRASLDFDVKKWLKISAGVDGTLIDSDIGASNSAFYANPFRNARVTAPIYPVYLVDQQTGEYILDGAGEKQFDDGGLYSRPINNGRNTVAELNWNSDDIQRNNFGNRVSAVFTIIDGLTATFAGSVDVQNYHYKGYENPEIGDGAPTARFDESRYTRTSYNYNQLLNYEKTFNEVHNLSALVGHESFSKEYTYQRAFKNQFIVSGIYELNNFVNTSTNTGYTTESATEGYLARLKYNYNNKYYIEGSFRRDGSSAFHEDVRWGNFYSVGGSWRIGEEEFITTEDWIDNLKLRASYGEVGNDDTGDFGYQALYETQPNNTNPGITWASVGNEALTWEVNKTFDVALDFAFFSRISGSIEWYNRKSDDLLYSMPLSPSMGLLEQPRNIASMYNRGLELNLEGDVIRTDDFKWNLNLIGSTISNEITSIPDPFVNGSKRWSEGHSVYDFWLRKYYDVDPEDGATRFHVWEDVVDADGVVTGSELSYDENGDPVLTKDKDDAGYGYVGASAFPDFQGSIGTTFSYKGLSLSALFTYSIGAKTLDYNYQELVVAEAGTGMHPDVKGAWKNPGDVTDIPRIQYSNSDLYATSDYFLTSADYLSIRNVTLNYDLPRAFLKQIGVGSARVFATGENLYTFTARKGLNPMYNFSGTQSDTAYSPSRTYVFGVSIQF